MQRRLDRRRVGIGRPGEARRRRRPARARPPTSVSPTAASQPSVRPAARTPGAVSAAARRKAGRARPPGGASRTEAKQHSGQAHVAGEAQRCRRSWPAGRAAAAIARPAARCPACATWARRRLDPRRLLGQLAEPQPLPPCDHEAVARVASRRIDIPLPRGGRAQQVARRRRRPRAAAARTRGSRSIPRSPAARASHWHRPATRGAGSTATISHAAPSSSAAICASPVHAPCPVSACGTATVTRPSRADLEIMAEHLLARAGGAARCRLARPGGEGDDQPDADAAADQQGAAVDCSAVNARALPSARRGRSCRCRAAAAARSEKIIRAGILNAASRRARKARSSSSSRSLPSRRMDDRDRHFAEPLVGRAEHRRLGDPVAGVERRLDLGRARYSRRRG